MTKSKICLILVLILDVFTIIIAYTDFIEIRGVGSALIFALPIIITIYFFELHKKSHGMILIILILVCCSSRFVFLAREHKSEIFYNKESGRYIYQIQKKESGARGSISYDKKVYYSLLETDFLTVRIVKESENYSCPDLITWD